MDDIFQGKDLEKALAAGLLSQDESVSEKPFNKAYQGVTSQNTSTLTPKETPKRETPLKSDRGEMASGETVKLSIRIPKYLKQAHDAKREGTFNKWVIRKVKEDLK